MNPSETSEAAENRLRLVTDQPTLTPILGPAPPATQAPVKFTGYLRVSS